MLKDLFFNIWYDDMGSGWFLLINVLFLLCLAFVLFAFARIKATNTSFSKKHYISFGLAILIMYQLIPVTIDFCANAISKFDIKDSIKLEQIAINSSVIPWQKGGYYCKLATLHFIDKNYKKMYETQDLAYNYLKSYKYPCWGMNFISFYIKGDYDKAIEIAKNSKKLPSNQFISNCYIMKGDIDNAELYIDKDIQAKESFSNLATKAYILKIKGNKQKSIEYYKKAQQLCKNTREKNTAERIYKNFVESEKERCNSLRKQQGIELEI